MEAIEEKKKMMTMKKMVVLRRKKNKAEAKRREGVVYVLCVYLLATLTSISTAGRVDFFQVIRS